jgi:hypothetical protein
MAILKYISYNFLLKVFPRILFLVMVAKDGKATVLEVDTVTTTSSVFTSQDNFKNLWMPPKSSELVLQVLNTYTPVQVKPNINTLPTSGYRYYYGIINGDIVFFGGQQCFSTEILISIFVTLKEAKQKSLNLKKIQNLSDSNQKKIAFAKWEEGFASVNIQPIDEQQLILSKMRKYTIEDGKERGSFVKIYTTGPYRISFEEGFVVSEVKNEVAFSFPVNTTEEISLVDKKGNYIIGTVHLHTHDWGLSGSENTQDVNTPGDVANVYITKIPWVTVGPTLVHAGFLNKQNRVATEKVRTPNILLFILNKIAIPL